MAPSPASLQGTCKLRAEPAPSDELFDWIAGEYAALAAEYGPRNVLVLKRHPAGLERLTAALAAVGATDGTPQSPRVESLPEHASKVLEALDPTLDRLEYEERIELISLVIDGASREVPAYLERAADHESFARDVGQLLLEATRQRLRLADVESEDPHDALAFLYAMNDRFHAELEDRDYVERADVIPRTVDALEANTDDLRTRIGESIDAVLAIEFEEYRRLDRRYLAALTVDADLVCLGERHASVERTRVESGSIEDHVGDGLEIEVLESDENRREPEPGTGTPPHRAVTRVLAMGETPRSNGHTEHDDARRIRTRTAREQVRSVATEIQALRDRNGWSYDDVAVAVPRIERVPETRTQLREAGIPTATIGTPSLAEDPAVNELYAFVTLQCARERDSNDRIDAALAGDRGPPDRDADDPETVAVERLRARVDDFSPELLADCAGASVSQSLERWLRRTDLKGRIARDEDWIDAREGYAGVRRVLEIARFVEETDLVGPDWRGLRRMLRRTIQYDAPYVHAVETQPPTGGVTVCAVDDLKYDSREAVFLLDLIDDTYPGEQFLTQLFPTAWLREMDCYPAVTDPDVEDVTATFATVDADGVGDPFETYHAQRSRRRLALGSRAARSRLYCCSYERGAGGLRRTYDESRYLQELEATPELELRAVDADTDAAIHGESNALEALLAQPRGELERILREASTGGEADLGATEELFEEIAVVLAEGDVDDELAEAVRSQFEFAAGEVVRDD
ncbi:hypothetical protein Htur_3208 [Haloterrigena turkmenica DSM 5511]|uniref:Uncharacterized protein n=1 Tax=Haloterrigena turkmenica (strain ATCC 51198 / DSM 5511 / JCM 9101 / NCIMB 13204 / VKM B-1734 / 4k) TaxID=543526 RepID=D2RZN4_HALTV|nr:hypothetical protein [Haloterrigena turkmenica]ADB62073.1 hypothetical protein Htur_3208 [Haloterrigena turkmenica DSM 5511]